MVGIDKVKVRFDYLALAHVSHFFQNESRGPSSNRRVLQSLQFLKAIFVSCAPAFGTCVAPSPAFRRILSTFFSLRFVSCASSARFCGQHPGGHVGRSFRLESTPAKLFAFDTSKRVALSLQVVALFAFRLAPPSHIF